MCNTICKNTLMRVCVTYYLFYIFNISCHSLEDAKKLLVDKKLGYEKTFRPIKNQSNPIKINVGLELFSIQEFDEVK